MNYTSTCGFFLNAWINRMLLYEETYTMKLTANIFDPVLTCMVLN